MRAKVAEEARRAKADRLARAQRLQQEAAAACIQRAEEARREQARADEEERKRLSRRDRKLQRIDLQRKQALREALERKQRRLREQEQGGDEARGRPAAPGGATGAPREHARVDRAGQAAPEARPAPLRTSASSASSVPTPPAPPPRREAGVVVGEKKVPFAGATAHPRLAPAPARPPAGVPAESGAGLASSGAGADGGRAERASLAAVCVQLHDRIAATRQEKVGRKAVLAMRPGLAHALPADPADADRVLLAALDRVARLCPEWLRPFARVPGLFTVDTAIGPGALAAVRAKLLADAQL